MPGAKDRMKSLMRFHNLIQAPSSAVRRYLVVNPQELPLDSNGSFKLEGVFTVEVWMQKGTENPTQNGMGDYSVEVYRDESTAPQQLVRNTPRFQVTAVNSAYRYTVLLKVDGKAVDSKDIKLTADGQQGSPGTAGNGIVGTTAYYLLSTRSQNVTRSMTGWTTSIPKPTQEKPYLWRYTVTTYTKSATVYSEPELWESYSSGANANLLEQTNFSSLQAMDKWDEVSHLVPKSGQTVTAEKLQEVTTGIQGHNAFHDRTQKLYTQILYKTVLSQSLEGKLEPATWYTLSFWMLSRQDSSVDTSVDLVLGGGMADTAQEGYINGIPTNISSNGIFSFSERTAWTRFTLTFKTKDDLTDADPRISWRLMPLNESGGQNEVYICMPKLEVGLQATSYLSNEGMLHQAQPRRRRWALNTQYLAGGLDEPFQDVVLYGSALESVGIYKCTRSHISTILNRPGTTLGAQYWSSENSAMFENLSTDLFFAEKSFINNLIAMLVMTDYEGNARVEMEGSRFEIFGQGQAWAGIRLEVDDTGTPSLAFYNKDGLRTFYLNGNDGLKGIESSAAAWKTVLRKRVSSASPEVSEVLDVADASCTDYYHYTAAFHRVSGTVIYDDTGSATPPTAHNRTFRAQSTTAAYIPDGYYIGPNNGVYKMIDTGGSATPVGSAAQSSKTYMVEVYQYQSGRLAATTQFLFTK